MITKAAHPRCYKHDKFNYEHISSGYGGITKHVYVYTNVLYNILGLFY